MALYNSDLTINSGDGGSVRVTLATRIGQGNGGTSLPCRTCFVAANYGNEGVVRMNIGSAASAAIGIMLAAGVASALISVMLTTCVNQPPPLEVPVNDVNLLHFYGATSDIVDITYLK